MAPRTKHTYRGYVAGKSPERHQERMFGAASLPLWSKTAPPGRVERFEPQPYVHQDSFTTCRVCHDTGHTSAGWCTCPAGQVARARSTDLWKSEEEEPVVAPLPPPPPPYVLDDATVRTIRVRNDPQATAALDPEDAIDVALAYLGHEVDDWELDDVDQPNDHTVILQFSRL